MMFMLIDALNIFFCLGNGLTSLLLAYSLWELLGRQIK
ncbi:hypothetical protein Pint_31172 [Pistacia integerrima]|uniref:Uncharacterized protein n=2 Tax=Pistacia TaxID=55512 RepID=A0ACC1A8W3_9ROSI|nr:hypothetical protein Pint_31172 [Pistacia integerrima]KAJ0083410.1 hypothetical protein Patl1_29634 [Pistacia atlantica]